MLPFCDLVMSKLGCQLKFYATILWPCYVTLCYHCYVTLGLVMALYVTILWPCYVKAWMPAQILVI